MFNGGIQKLLSTSSRMQAMQRVAELENLVAKTSAPTENVSTQSFRDVMEVVPPVDFSYQLQEPAKLSKGDISNIVKSTCQKYGVDDKLVMALINQESGFNQNAISKVGAQGLMQLMPATAKSLGVTNALDPVQNIEGGVKYLQGLLNQFHGNKILALAAYNAGPNAVKKYNGIPPYKETQNYVKNILKNYL